jgi:putative oxidoreductase
MVGTNGYDGRFAWPCLQSWHALPLRLIVGHGFMEHGYAKLVRGPENFAAILHALGMPAPLLLGWATIGAELVCGLMVLVGLLIPLASIPMVVTLLVAIFTVHLPNGFSSIKLLSVDAAGAHFGQPGYETDLLYLVCLLALVLGGSGPFALDRLIFRAWRVQKSTNILKWLDYSASFMARPDRLEATATTPWCFP